MLLWTVQNYKAYEYMLNTGVLKVSQNKFISEVSFESAYIWMVEKMKERSILSFEGINFPVWAWYQWEGKRKRRDMRGRGFAEKGEKIVQLTIEVADEDVLLSDFDLFHYVLNYWYLPINQQDDLEFEEEYKSLGFTWKDLQDFSIKSQEMCSLREKIIRSWDRIFEIEREDGYLYEYKNKKSIQATFWSLRLNQVKRVEIYIAK